MSYQPRNILVTGGAGFIGCNFVRWMLSMDDTVRIVNLDDLTYAGSLHNLEALPDPDRHVFVRGSINDESLVRKLLAEHQIDTLVHFAAESHVDRSITGPADFVQTNIVGTFHLLEAVRREWGSSSENCRFLHISTDEVYGTLEPMDPPFQETTPYAPSSPYSASKAASDHLVRSYFHTYELPVLITNCSNNYGPYQYPEKLIPLMLTNMLAGKPLPVYGDGLQVRDWLYVEDHCQAISKVLCRGRLGETYNVGGDCEHSNLDLLHTLCGILEEHLPSTEPGGYARLITHVADRPGHDRRYAIDATKIKQETGWYPKESLATGLEKTVRWYLGHQDWQSCISGQELVEWTDLNYANR